MVRRSQMEILIDILRAVADGKRKPTHIMYKANLSWTRLKRQLDFLTKQELLVNKVTEEGTIYKITPKGKEVLEYFKKIEGELYYKKRALPTEVYIHYK
ncbi:MAG: winged helix-turn-helix domain-containing protein [Candidatus Bathyarchaeia archaeon]